MNSEKKMFVLWSYALYYTEEQFLVDVLMLMTA